MKRSEYRTEILHRLQAAGYEAGAAGAKGDGFFIRGQGFVSTAKAAQLVGAPAYEAEPRPVRLQARPWGDFATNVMLNSQRK